MKKNREQRREEYGSMDMDRLTELPQPIVHHILCLLTQKEAIQTCVLSKSWRYLGSTRPKLDFSEKYFPGNTVVIKTLQRYHDQNLYLQNFVLEIPESSIDSDSRFLLEKWIPIVVANIKNLKTLSLNLPTFAERYFALPSVFFQAESLEELYLSRCEIGFTENVLFKCLQTLCLICVSIEEETFEKIMSSCPSIKSLVVVWCVRLRKINFWSISDKAQNIKICYYMKLNWYRHHNNNCFPRLKSLYLSYVDLCTNALDIFSSNNFPSLEELELDFCYGFEEIHLSSHSIKRLSIIMHPSYSTGKLAVAIDAPNILCFKLSVYKTCPSPFSFTKTSSREWKSDISVSCPYIPNDWTKSTWFLNLNEMLNALNQSQISLDFNYMCFENHSAQVEGGFDDPVVVEHLSVRRFFPNLLDCLFRICRPRYIQIIGFNPLDEQKDSESFCKFLKNERRECYFWQQDLEEFSIQVWDKNGAEWHPVEGTNVPEYTSDEQKARFQLKWRD